MLPAKIQIKTILNRTGAAFNNILLRFLFAKTDIYFGIKKVSLTNWIGIAGIIVGLMGVYVPIYLNSSNPEEVASKMSITEESIKTTIIDYVANDQKIMKSKMHAKVAECWSSNASSRNDAKRCLVLSDNSIYDPCFMEVGASRYLDCPFDPYTSNNIVLDSGKVAGVRIGNNSQADNLYPNPWYIKLTKDISCYFITGATEVIADKRLDYHCKNSELWLLLPINKDSDPYSISCYAPNTNAIKSCLIKEMWY